MAETMEQYMSKTRADYSSGVARPKIEDKDNFELKGQFLKELCTSTFSGSDHEDANEHIKKVLEIVDLFHILNITIDQVMLRAFPMSLTGVASRWLRNKPTEMHKVILFYNGLGIPTRHILDSRGAIPSKTAADVKVVIQEIAEYSQKWHNGTSRNNANPSYQERRQSMEDTLRKFISESTKIHEENSNLIKEIRASTDAAIRNQGASVKTLEIQIGQMSKVLQKRGFGSLPSSTKANPRDQVKSISTTTEVDSYMIRRIRSSQYVKGSYGPHFSEAYSEASHIDNSIPRKEKDPGSFTLP
ncbi:hypothetical protein Tco_1083854 [Tanacetum coccineum]